MADNSTELRIHLPGVTDIGESIPRELGEPYNEPEKFLAYQECEDIELEVGWSNDENIREDIGFFIQLSVTHAKNPETERLFNSILTVHPSRDDVVKLRDYLTFLLLMVP